MNILNFFTKDKKLSGEISNIRQEESILTIESTGFILDSSKVDYQLSRELYNNTHENYKLGGHFCRPVINAQTGFIGVPKISSLTEDETANIILDKHLNNKKSKLSHIIRNQLIEGDCILYVYYQRKDNELYKNEFQLYLKTLLPENVKLIKNENEEIEKAIIITEINYKDENRQNIKYKVVETWTNEEYKKTYSEIDLPTGYNKLVDINVVNPIGFIPIIHFKNEMEDYRMNGTSELEPIEPLIRAYHETMYNYLRASKVNSSPILCLKLNDKQSFLMNNFTSEERKNKNIKVLRKDMLTLTNDEEAYYLEIQAKSYSELLELLFMCLVDVSEIPEFVFGTAVASSKASVSEQMPAFIKKIERKRNEMEDGLKLLARMVFSITNQFGSEEIINSFETKIDWKEVDKEDINLKTQSINNITTSLINAVNEKLISWSSAINQLSKFIDTMETSEDEKKKIIEEFEERIEGDQTEELLEQIEALKTELNSKDPQDQNEDDNEAKTEKEDNNDSEE